MSLQVVIVGCGPAGMNAAIEAHLRGSRVTVIDEAPRPGGQIFRQSAVEPGLKVGLDTELKRKHSLLRSFDSIVDKIDYRPEHTVYALFEGPEIHLSNNNTDTSEVLRPDVVVLATGVCERSVPFPGWTLPGVMYAGGVQSLMKAQGVGVGDRVVVAGAGPLPVAVAAQLVEAGVNVETVAVLNPLRSMLLNPYALWAGRKVIREGWQYLGILRRKGVEILSRMIPLRADGSVRVQSVQLAEHDGTGRPLVGTEQRRDCDVLAVNYGFTANSELANMAGSKLEYHSEQGGWLPVTDRLCRTSVPAVLVAGDGACLRGAWVAQAEGRIAGAVASCYYDELALNALQDQLKEWFDERQQHESFQVAVQGSLYLPDGVTTWADDETVICRCECVTRGQIQSAIEDGHITLNGVKRNTRAGMGWCGGRMCMQNVAACVNAGRVPVDMAPITPRPLARPVSLRSLRNQEGQ